jgi:hypothetical protein
MKAFNGFSEEFFQCCKPSEKIRKPINALKELRFEIEPELKRINPSLIGHVSRTKKKGTNEYYDWAWLYFNTKDIEPYRYSQLTVNISPHRLYVGANIRTYPEHESFLNGIGKEENWSLFQQLARTLSGREWIISTSYDDDWEQEIPRRYSVEELRGRLLDPYLRWINASFEKDEQVVKTSKIVDEIVQIFKELYNIYALASDNETTLQPDPKFGVFKQKIVIDSEESKPESDENAMFEIEGFLSSLETHGKQDIYHLPGKKDERSYKRTALEYDLRPCQTQLKGKIVTIYSDKDIQPFLNQICQDYLRFSEFLLQIGHLMHLPEDFLKVMFVDPKSDARYYGTKEPDSIFVNLARFQSNRTRFFWLYAVCRELAYFKAHHLGYRFLNELRNILAFALNNLEASKASSKVTMIDTH